MHLAALTLSGFSGLATGSIIVLLAQVAAE